MKNIFKNSLVLVTLAVMCVMNVVLTSCAGETDLREPEKITVTKMQEVPVLVMQDKLVNIVSNIYFDGKTIVVGDKVAATVDVNHEMPIIEMPADEHAAASITSSNGLEWSDSNGQNTTGTLNIVDGDNYEIFGTLYPAANYSSITKVHPKVSVINTHHVFEGSANVTVADDTQSKSFNFDIARQYILSDPTVDVEIVNTHTTDTLIQVVVKTDTIVNTVTVRDTVTIVNNIEVIKHDTVTVTNTVTLTDTIQVEVERFVKGADVVKSVVNDFGFSKGTMTLGNKQLLAVEIRHQNPILDVKKSVFGNVSFSNTAALRWEGSDTQKTNASVNAQGCTVNGVDYLRAEYTDISGMKQVRTIYRVYGTYTNENGDVCEFEMEMAPSYLQTYTEIVPQNNDHVVRYEVVDTYKDKQSGDVKLRKLTLKVTKYVDDVETEKWTYVGNVIISGYVAGYDMFVADATVLRKEYTDAEDYDSSYNYSNRPVTGNEKFSETMSSHIWSYKNFFRAHSGGEVNTNSEIRFQSMIVTFTDGDFTWSSKPFEKNVEVVYDQIDQDSDLQGSTREESGRHFTYGGTHRLTVKNLVDGEEFFTSTAVSPLYVQD